MMEHTRAYDAACARIRIHFVDAAMRPILFCNGRIYFRRSAGRDIENHDLSEQRLSLDIVRDIYNYASALVMTATYVTLYFMYIAHICAYLMFAHTFILSQRKKSGPRQTNKKCQIRININFILKRNDNETLSILFQLKEINHKIQSVVIYE